MNKLSRELQRLYFLKDAPPAGMRSDEDVSRLNLVGLAGTVRTLIVCFRKSGDWSEAAKLHDLVQRELELPAPAVVVSGSDGFQLWFSLAEPVPVDQAFAFLAGLRERYLGHLPETALAFHPQPGAMAGQELALFPALCESTGRWSALIDPSMGSMFLEQAGLDMAPNPDRQADLLATLESIKAGDFARALDSLQAPDEAPAGVAASAACSEYGETSSSAPLRDLPREQGLTGRFDSPRAFLLAVMNDEAAPLPQRIEAAKALLPYFENTEAR